jgi:hypothetical protein
MRARSHHDTPSAGLRVVACLAALVSAVGPVAACGLSLGGLAPLGASSVDASLVDSIAPRVDASRADGTIDAIDAEGDDAIGDAASIDSSLPVDAADAGSPCVAYDAGLNAALVLSTFVVTGSASYNENSDGKITLTNSSNDQAGAAWYPTTMPDVSGYDLTWSLRIGPGDTDGEGITFAVLSSDGMPKVGDDGDGLGLRNITESGGDGGVPSGYAVELVTYDNTTDPTNLGATTLKLATMPGFTPVAETLVPAALNDGNVYAVDVSWRAPSYVSATLHEPDGGLINVTSSNPGLTASSPYFGFTGATGGISDSHNEIAGITVTDTCE